MLDFTNAKKIESNCSTGFGSEELDNKAVKNWKIKAHYNRLLLRYCGSGNFSRTFINWLIYIPGILHYRMELFHANHWINKKIRFPYVSWKSLTNPKFKQIVCISFTKNKPKILVILSLRHALFFQYESSIKINIIFI